MWKQDGKQSSSDSVDLDDKESSSQAVRPQTADDVSAFVGKGVEFKGTITYNGTVRIDGLLDGEIHTDGVLLVGDGAVITARVTAGTIVCKGKITGDVHAKEKIKLRAPASISGGVKTPLLSIEEGVLFNGTLEMTQGVRELPRETAIQPVSLPGQSGIRRMNG